MENSQSTGTGAGLLLAGRYRLGESIGRGGMGKVWRAHDELLHRTVAVKELTAGMYASESDRSVLHARTQKEARAAARISHPGVVTVHDVLEHDARPWIVMQYVDGPSLADVTKESGRIPAGDAARIGLDVLRALGAAHAAGVLHRDVKPANVLLSRDGQTLITDFGIAAIEGDATITRTGEIVGSIDYLAPERVRGGDPGPASDLWSLGATLYTAVEGESPFRRSSPLSTMQAVVTDEPRRPEHAGPLAEVIMALLRKDPAARLSSAEAERILQAVTEGRTHSLSPALSPTLVVPAEQGMAQSPRPYAGETRPAPAPAGSPAGGPGWSGGPDSAAARPRRGGRLRTAALVVVVSAVVGLGAGFAVMQYGDGSDNGDGDNPKARTAILPEARVGSLKPSAPTGKSSGAGPDPTPPSAAPPSGSPGASDEVPEGWQRVRDPAGFSLLVPDGWTRKIVVEGQIDYVPPGGGGHRFRIGIDAAPDFENPYLHLLGMEEDMKVLRPTYQRVTLEANVFRDHRKSALWEFTWTEEKTSAEWRAIDQMYFADDGTEYAFYMAGPVANWPEVRKQFDTMLRSWRQTG
ncbi:serine/threonine-protein kinase [Streptomyces sp. CAU 1734]|uniref:serine/threonine-protein kinase n=1 Tax=Streptomyces sp. CAU 1734 TaxID=3140360 RepID=UPI003261CEA5